MNQIAPFGLRIPPDLKTRIKAEADTNYRSMNAEIVSTLAGSYPVKQPDAGENVRETVQFKLAMPSDVKDWLAARAASSLRSQSAEIILILRERMNRAGAADV